MNVNAIMQFLAVAILPLLFAITLHEAAHGWVASKLGDKTALMLGRVTLNPIKHIDPVGTVFFPLVMLFASSAVGGGLIFGWAKPVPVSWQNLNHPKRDMALVALAGPAANLLMAILWAIIGKVCLIIFQGDTAPFLQMLAQFFHRVALFGIMINCVLMILNLIPIPPLDGSRVVSSLLPPAAAMVYERLEPYGIWIVFAFLFLVYYTNPMILYGPILAVVNLIRTLFGI